MFNEHGITLLEQDMKEICLIVNELQEEELKDEKVILFKILFELRKDVNELKAIKRPRNTELLETPGYLRKQQLNDEP